MKVATEGPSDDLATFVKGILFKVGTGDVIRVRAELKLSSPLASLFVKEFHTDVQRIRRFHFFHHGHAFFGCCAHPPNKVFMEFLFLPG
jgi:hypothetical protein